MFDKEEFVKKSRENGIVGAGGAGFPFYVKVSSQAQKVLVNAAECEPLLRKDQVILSLYPQKVIEGLKLVMKSCGSSEGIIGIKKKHEKIISRLKEICKSEEGISVLEMGDYYPAGDEFCLVYEATGKVIGPGAIPLSVGCVVSNVETLYNAAISQPVTEKFITIAGEVKSPATMKVPVGVSWKELVELCGGFKVKNPVAIDGGPMMGKVITDFSQPVIKTSAGIIVLDASHPLIKRKTRGKTQFMSINRSACDQCSFCTEFCPRYLLGHNVQPHRVMRSSMFSSDKTKIHNEYSLLCCECSLCSLYSCPEGLSPREACLSGKADLKEKGLNVKNSQTAAASKSQVHPLREYRKTPVKKLIKKLGLYDLDKPADFIDLSYNPQKVKIMLTQHAGTPAFACVKIGQKVKKGDIVGMVEEGKLGCPVHASIDGKISDINLKFVEIEGLNA